MSLDADQDVIRQGLRWSLNPSDFMHADLFWLGTEDTWDLHHAQRMVTRGSVILDIGANFGYYSLKLASALKGECVVHAFEPNPPTYARLVHHIRVNGLGSSVTAHSLGLAERPGFATISEKSGNSGAANLTTSADDRDPIRLTSIDVFRAEAGLPRVDFIKIDVEGFEEHVIAGGIQTLTEFKPTLVVELEPARLGPKGSSVSRVAGMLTGLGYDLFSTKRGRLIPLNDLPHRPEDQVNAFCIHPDRKRG